MQRLIQNIELLVMENNFVVIPGFGGFVSETDGSFEADGTLYPPHKSIGFNGSLTYNDGLLAQQYVKNENISFNEANQMIYAEVEKMKAMLEQWRHFRFGSIGMFHLTESGILFEPSNKETFLHTSYGLTPVFFPKISIAAQSEAQNKVQSKEVEAEQPAEKQQHATITWGYRMVAAAAVIIMLLMFPINVSDSRHQAQQILNQASLVPATEMQMPMIQEEEPLDEVVVTPENKTYNIIIGSLYSQSKAEQFLSELPADIKDSCRILVSEHKYRISYKTFSTEDECDEFLEAFATANPRYSNAWILEWTE